MIALIQFVDLLIGIYIGIIIVSAIASWLAAFNIVDTNQPFFSALFYLLWRVTDPALRPIRAFLPNLGGLDISPMILILGLIVLRSFLRGLLY